MAGPGPDYSAEVERRFRALPAAGDLPGGPGRAVSAGAGHSAAGARVELLARFNEGRITDARFRAYGCPHLIAATSWLAEWLPGRAPGELATWDWQEVATDLAVPPAKYGRLLVLQDAVRSLATACERAVAASL